MFLVFALGVLVTSASAQTIDKKTYFTFSGPVEIPGATLPAGKYLFHLMDPDSGRQVLQVQSADGKKVYSAFFSVPAQRPEAPNNPEVRFMETAAGSPAAISTVWYIGERTGRELIYPRDQAMRIAKNTHAAVLTTKSETTKTEDGKSGDLVRISPTGQDVEYSANTAPAEPTGRLQRGANDDADRANTPVAQSSSPLAKADTPRAARTPIGTAGQSLARRRLPQTASNTPFILMLGVGFLTMAAMMRLSRTGWM
jgi:hypothetical protein